MYLLVVYYSSGSTEYYGPFPTRDRTREYATAVERQLNPDRWHIVPLTVPYMTVVKNIEWVVSSTARDNFLDGR